MLKKIITTFILFIFSVCYQVATALPLDKTENTSIELFRISQDEFLAKFTIKPNWHIYWVNPGEIGKPTIVSGDDVPLELINSTVPEVKIFYDTIEEYIYNNDAYYLFKLKNPNTSEITFSFTECSDSCQAEKISFKLSDVPVIEQNERQNQMSKAQMTFPKKIKLVSPRQFNEVMLPISNYENVSFVPIQFQAAEQGSIKISNIKNSVKINWLDNEVNKLNQALIITPKEAYLADIEYKDATFIGLVYIIILAFLGGVILNAMPCVFPILSLKIFSLIKHRNNRKKAFKEAVGYTLGVLFSFWLLTACIVYLKNHGESVGWGFQLQSPLFVAVMALIFFVLFLFMVEWLHFPSMKRQALYRLANLNAFCTGFFAVLIASPCTGPFMGAAIGYALMGTTTEIYAIFTALALGYAFPYALIQMYPQILKNILPKPGVWMQKIKIILAIPLLFTAVWLCTVFYKQINDLPTTNQEIVWQPYDTDIIADLNDNGKNIFINFTADWCLTCQFNKKLFLNGESFKNFVKENNVYLFEADMTEDNDEYIQALKSYGRAGIPTYIYYSNKSYKVLPMFFSLNSLNE